MIIYSSITSQSVEGLTYSYCTLNCSIFFWTICLLSDHKLLRHFNKQFAAYVFIHSTQELVKPVSFLKCFPAMLISLHSTWCDVMVASMLIERKTVVSLLQMPYGTGRRQPPGPGQRPGYGGDDFPHPPSELMDQSYQRNYQGAPGMQLTCWTIHNLFTVQRPD